MILTKVITFVKLEGRMFKQRKIFRLLDRYSDCREAIVITGFRRVGKTSVSQHIFEKIKSTNKIFLDLESPVNQKFFEANNYDNIRSAFSGLGLNFKQKAYIFLDEIQNVKNLPSVVKYLYDHNDIKFFLTGSSSFYLKNLFSESLSGRKFIFELYPLDFEEFLWFKDQKLSLKADYDLLSGFYQEYLNFGGFPGVVLADSSDQKLRQLDDVLGSYFQIDVKNLAGFRDNENLKKLLFLLSSRVAGKPEVGKLAESLNVSRQTVYQYLNFFEQTYLIHFLKPLSGSRDVQIKVMPKIYFNDTGILNRIGQISQGQLFENKVFNQLFTREVYRNKKMSDLQEKVNYYQEKSGAEIDFIVNKTAYEVKLQASGFDVRKLKKVAARVGLKQVKVISLNQTKVLLPEIIYPFDL